MTVKVEEYLFFFSNQVSHFIEPKTLTMTFLCCKTHHYFRNYSSLNLSSVTSVKKNTRHSVGSVPSYQQIYMNIYL